MRFGHDGCAVNGLEHFQFGVPCLSHVGQLGRSDDVSGHVDDAQDHGADSINGLVDELRLVHDLSHEQLNNGGVLQQLN